MGGGGYRHGDTAPYISRPLACQKKASSIDAPRVQTPAHNDIQYGWHTTPSRKPPRTLFGPHLGRRFMAGVVVLDPMLQGSRSMKASRAGAAMSKNRRSVVGTSGFPHKDWSPINKDPM